MDGQADRSHFSVFLRKATLGRLDGYFRKSSLLNSGVRANRLWSSSEVNHFSDFHNCTEKLVRNAIRHFSYYKGRQHL